MGRTDDIRYFTSSLSIRLGVLAFTFFIGMLVMSVVVQPLSGISGSQRIGLLWASTAQNLIVFAIPAYLTAFLIQSEPWTFLGTNRIFRIKGLVFMLFVLVAGIPFLDWIISINEKLSLPVSLKDIETSLRQMEAAASEVTNVILSVKGIESLCVNILIVGVLTGFCEELFFRGALQNILIRNGINSNTAIWISAFIFSLLHFQFFGFIPRLLLGAFFGYLFYWSGSLWLSILAHIINNTMVVVLFWIEYNTAKSFSIVWLEHPSVPIILLSLLLVLSAFVLMRKSMFSSHLS